MASLSTPKWVSWWFRGAAIYGAVALGLAALAPSASASAGLLDHYGFIFTALAFQGVFWVIGGAPSRYRALMPCGVAEKLAFGAPVVWLYAIGRLDPATLGFGLFDLLLGAGFLLAWRATPAA